MCCQVVVNRAWRGQGVQLSLIQSRQHLQPEFELLNNKRPTLLDTDLGWPGDQDIIEPHPTIGFIWRHGRPGKTLLGQGREASALGGVLKGKFDQGGARRRGPDPELVKGGHMFQLGAGIGICLTMLVTNLKINRAQPCPLDKTVQLLRGGKQGLTIMGMPLFIQHRIFLSNRGGSADTLEMT